MAIGANRRLGYLERGIVELEKKFLKRVEHCQIVEGTEGGHLARAYLLLELRELGICSIDLGIPNLERSLRNQVDRKFSFRFIKCNKANDP